MLNNTIKYKIALAEKCHIGLAQSIVDEINYSAKIRGTGIPDRTVDYIIEKIEAGLAVLAIDQETGKWIGFCCIDVWSHKKYIASTGLIIKPEFRGIGISKAIKYKIFEICRDKFPHSKIFSLSANPVVIKVNMELGFKSVSFNSVMNDSDFITGNNCKVNFVEMMKEKSEDSGYLALIYEPDQISPVNHVFTKPQTVSISI